MDRPWGKIGVGALIIAIAVAGAFWAVKWFAQSGVGRRPTLAAVPPLAPVTRSSVIVTPVFISLAAIQDALEQAAPRDLSGKPNIPMPPNMTNGDIGWSLSRDPFAIKGGPEGLVLSSALRGSFRATGQMTNLPGGGFPGGPPGGFGGPPGGFGGPPGGFRGPPGGFFQGPPGGFRGPSNQGGSAQEQPGAQNEPGKTTDQRVEISGSVMLTARPNLLPGWRLEPNLTAQVTIADASASIMGMNLNLSDAMKPMLERTINDQVAALQARLVNDPFLEQAARRAWTNICRSIPLGASAVGMPNLWLELRPTKALAAQPRIDETALTLTIGVQAETRIASNTTNPDCPFPAQLDLVPQMERGRISIDVPIDIPFNEVNRLIETQLKGKVFPVDKNGAINATVQSVNLAASDNRLLITLGIRANETRSWFGLAADATVYVWGRPVLDRERQVLRFDHIELDVESRAAFGALGAAARTQVPYLEKTLTDNAVIDLARLAANARKNIEAAIADFRNNADGVTVDTAVVDMRLAEIKFDANTLRVIAEADGTVAVTVTKLKQR